MTINEGKSEGCERLDMGRSDSENEGLIRFKDRWGSYKSELTYWRLLAKCSKRSTRRQGIEFAKKLFGYAPGPLQIEVGNVLYKHLG
jgi:hypothetical protein